jgi:transposase
MRFDRDDHSDVHNDVSKPVRPRRIEVINGVERRRKWADETKIVIVAEALEAGVVISDVARRHDVNPSQLFGWVRQFRDEALALRGENASPDAPAFVPAVLDAASTPVVTPVPVSASREAATIEITIGPATVRVRGLVDGKSLAVVLKALKVLA